MVRYKPDAFRTTQAWRVIKEPMELREHSLDGVGGAAGLEQLARPDVVAAADMERSEVVGVGLIVVAHQLEGIDGPAD
jgi:hypothetical protein